MLGFGPADIENGFGRLSEIGVTPQMAEAFQSAYTYINIVKASLGGTYDVSMLADQRNITQYTLCLVPPPKDIPTYFSHPTQTATYEACRLASLIFGVGVIFPIPAQNTPLTSLMRQIQTILRERDSSGLWSSPAARIPLIWILTMAGIAATDTPERPFFVSALGETARRSGLASWPDVKRALEMMLWLDVACDEAGEYLWLEANRSYAIE